MIGYMTLGTQDFERACCFYDELLATLGAQRLQTTDRASYWGKPGRLGFLGVLRPFDGKPASVGNGVMVALATRSKDTVERAYHLAISLGAMDEGAPGVRSGGAYGAYFRDLDGNKLFIYTLTKSSSEKSG